MIRDAAIGKYAKARKRKRRSQPVTAEPLSTAIVIGTKGEACMQVEPKMSEGIVRERRGGLGRAIALAGGVLDSFDGAALGADVREFGRSALKSRWRRFGAGTCASKRAASMAISAEAPCGLSWCVQSAKFLSKPPMSTKNAETKGAASKQAPTKGRANDGPSSS